MEHPHESGLTSAVIAETRRRQVLLQDIMSNCIQRGGQVIQWASVRRADAISSCAFGCPLRLPFAHDIALLFDVLRGHTVSQHRRT
ncbi:MAG: hypothetical protein AAGL96_18780 [Pseudomonadota bacterium]